MSEVWTIEQAICECTRKAEANRALAKYNKSHVDRANDLKNAEECEQLAAWLRELVERRKAPEIIFCHECKHWKDSDGVYRRGICAESKCPVNSRQVYEGTFFCGMAERRTDV